ncbi:MAG TPA: hypothetical protein ENF80_00140 [Thermofilum sp.]|nr:hypothetical protein [Thermofilum sp.]
MKTIAVDKTTWKKLKRLREKIGARSYDEVIKRLIELWNLTELDKIVSEVTFPDDKVRNFALFINDRKRVTKNYHGE